MYPDEKFRKCNASVHDESDEKKMIRELAAEVSEWSRSPEMQHIRKRWADSTEKRSYDRPPVWCNPVGCWKELLPDDLLVCHVPELREMEIYFKRLLIKREIGDDTLVSPIYDIAPVAEATPANEWGLDIRLEKLDAEGSAWRYVPSLNEEADFDRLTVPRYHCNAEATRIKRDRAEELLGDAMPVRINALGPYFSAATICVKAAMLRGLEPMMMDMICEPELVHRLMTVMRQGVMNHLDALEASGYLFPNIDSPMLCSGPLRENHTGRYTLSDCWIHGNSQEFDQVSPEMFEEFLLNYQKPIFARFGAVCYGCCENLTRKLDAVLSIPNLKLLTCSAWTDLRTLVEKNDRRCCVMWRHKASDVVCPDDLGDFGKKVKEQVAILGDSHYQVILRELQTLMGHDNRLSEWTKLSIDAVS